MAGNVTKGKLGENLAADFLIKKGFKIIERNWRYSTRGEIDIIAIDQKTLVFIEVKTRTSINFGHPVESVNKNKIDRIKILAGLYLTQNPDLKFKNYRFDAIGIILAKEPEITYYQDIYQF